MFRIVIFLLLLFAMALGFSWLADNPGTVQVQWDWLNKGEAYEVKLLHAMIAIVAIVAIVMMVWWVVSGVLHSPQIFDRWRSTRRREKGYTALSQGLIAAGAGNAPLARKLTKESGKLLENEPLVQMLDAQTAQLEGKGEEARQKYESMLDDPETQLLGFRGLYLEAQKEGNGEASAHFASQAYALAPQTPWAAKALIKAQGVVGDWEQALKTLETSRASGLYEKDVYTRKRAVILTALAMQLEDSDPDKARGHALAAQKLAPALAPAADVAARLCVRLDDPKKATKVLEASWKQHPHPDLAQAYVHLNSGDSARDRLKRAERLASRNKDHLESQFVLAQALLDAGEFASARKAVKDVLAKAPTERACLLMADIEEAEHGDQGRVREWLARAVTAPRDAAWTADGFVAEEWAPFSPLTGELDAFQWRVPVEQIGGTAQAIDYSELPPVAKSGKGDDDTDEPTTIEMAVAANAASAAAAATATVSANVVDKADQADDVVDAEIVEATDLDASIAAMAVEIEPVTEPEAETPDKEKVEPAPEKPEATTEKTVPASASPFRQTNLDEDDDGIIDVRPDDPGPQPAENGKKKKNFFF